MTKVKVKHKAKPARKRKLEVDKQPEEVVTSQYDWWVLSNLVMQVKKVKAVSSLVVEQLVSSDSEVALSALTSLADGQEEKIQEFFAGNVESV